MTDYLPDPALPMAQPRTNGGNAAFHNFHNDYSHISDPNLRRRLALAEIDKVPFGWYHVRAVAVAGIGFFTDSYSLFAVNLITALLGMVYFQGSPISGSSAGGNNGVLPTSSITAINAATSGGAVIGQIVFGWLADLVGRRKMYGIELFIIVASTLAQSLSAPSTALTITGVLIFWRVIMGIGVGGDYPLSAVITSEFAPTRWRGAMMAAVFSMQGFGQATAALVALITTFAFKDAFIATTGSWASCHQECQVAGDRAWRIIVSFGALPACFAMYYRITIPETPRYTFDVAHDIEKADADIKAYMSSQKEGKPDPISQQETIQKLGHELHAPKATWRDAFAYFSQRRNFRVIFGTSVSWMLLDLAFYGLGLNNSTVLYAIGYSPGATIYDNLINAAIGNIVLVCAGSFPGYFLSIVTIDTIGRKPIQIVGFALLTVIFAILGFAYKSLNSKSLLALYIIAHFFFNFGPNTTTFIIPGECFPTRYRSTGHGFSAAMGKIGAVIAQVIAQPLFKKGGKENCRGSECASSLGNLMKIFTLFMFCGTLVSLLVPETKGCTLEELAGETSPSSLDFSRNGSVRTTDSKGWRRWNPFKGGKPAGWSRNQDPHLMLRSPRIRGRRARIGIMTDPEAVNNLSEQESHASFFLFFSPRWWWSSWDQRRRRKSQDHESDNENENGSGHGKDANDTRGVDASDYSISVNINDERTVRVGGDDDFGRRDGTSGVATTGGAPPGWGAGWGVQRSPRRGGRMESAMLQDVGSLLK